MTKLKNIFSKLPYIFENIYMYKYVYWAPKSLLGAKYWAPKSL